MYLSVLQELQNLGMSRIVEDDVLYFLNPIFVYKYVSVQPRLMENYRLLYHSVLEIPKIVLDVKTITVIQTVNFSDSSSTYSKFKITSVDGKTSWFMFKKSNLLLNTVAFYSAHITNKTVPRVQIEGRSDFYIVIQAILISYKLL